MPLQLPASWLHPCCGPASYLPCSHRSFVLLCTQAGVAVRDQETQLVRSLNNLLTFLRPNVVSDFHRVLLVVHQQHLQVGRVTHQELVEATFQTEFRLLVRTVTDVGHQGRALVLPPDTAINTTRLAPCRVHALEAVSLETRKLLGALLDDLPLVCYGRHLGSFPPVVWMQAGWQGLKTGLP